MLDFTKKVAKTKLIIIASISIMVLVFLLLFIIKSNHIDMTSLYKDISAADRAAILNVLNSLGINYDLDEGEIFVNFDQAREVRMLLAAEGLPSSGSIVGYEIFNKNEAFGTSSFTQNINLLRALEGELSRTIASFDNIQTARVHLVIPKKELFNKTINKPKASVVIKMRANSTLNNKQMSAITHLIASAVQDLDVNHITIVSTDGKPFRLPSDTQENIISSSLQEYKLETERKFKQSIERLVSNFVGIDKVKAEVNVELNLEHLSSDAEIFDPNGQVIRSIQNNEEDSSNTDNLGPVSVANNIPNSSSANGNESNSNSSSKKREEVVNYEISREVIKRIKEVGEIQKLSIAVLIDGNYHYDEKIGQSVYEPHSSEVIEKLRSLVSSAVGFNADRGDIIEITNMQFAPVNGMGLPTAIDDEQFNNNIYNIVKLLANLLAIIVVILIVKSILNKFLDKKRAEINSEEPVIEEIAKEEEVMPLVKKVEELIKNNPKHTVSMLRGWIK